MANLKNSLQNAPVNHQNKKIGWIGTGVMGLPMCMHLLKANYQIFVYNRTKSKADELLQHGAIWCNSPEEVATQSQVIFSIVGFPQDVEEIYFGDDGIFNHITPGSIMVDLTTSKPSLAQKIAKNAQVKQCYALDAPVSGGDIGAKQATLAIMVGGEKQIFDTMLPLFQLLGQNITYMGFAGAGQHTKMCNQIHIASTMIGMFEALLYATKSGLNPDEMINVIGKGAAASWSINNLGPRITHMNFDPGFFIKHFVKDMGIALEEAQKMNLALPGLALAYQFYQAAMAQGLENLGTHGLYKILAQMNNI